MDKFRIVGGKPLKGEVTISGAKNAAVAIIAAALLCDETCRIENLPCVSDVDKMLHVLSELGADVQMKNKSTYEVNCKGVRSYTVPYEMTGKTRASSYFMGAMLGKFRKAKVAPPGGCDFGVRPIDLHIKGFEALGANVNIDNGLVNIEADELIGNAVYMDKVSVGATINVILAAVKSTGLTVIDNAAKEPHIVDLANFLNSMGADIRGAGTDIIKIHGVKYLHGTTYSIIPDQIEAGTYMVAAAATGGDVLIKNVIPKHLESISAKLVEAGATVEEFDEAVRVTRTGELTRCMVKTLPHPGFPTDMQPQFATMLCIANGTSTVHEAVWDNRFRYVEQLTRMGAKIKVDGSMAVIEGVEQLTSAPVQAVDLRAGAAMVIAGLMANGVTEVEEIRHIQRGYETIIEKFTALGADIKLITETEVQTIKQIG